MSHKNKQKDGWTDVQSDIAIPSAPIPLGAKKLIQAHLGRGKLWRHLGP